MENIERYSDLFCICGMDYLCDLFVGG